MLRPHHPPFASQLSPSFTGLFPSKFSHHIPHILLHHCLLPTYSYPIFTPSSISPFSRQRTNKLVSSLLQSHPPFHSCVSLHSPTLLSPLSIFHTLLPLLAPTITTSLYPSFLSTPFSPLTSPPFP